MDRTRMPKDMMTNTKKNKDGLTPRQLEVFKVIKGYIKQNGFAPSYEEIKQLLGYNSKSPVHSMIHRLIARGWIKNGNGRNRSISIV